MANGAEVACLPHPVLADPRLLTKAAVAAPDSVAKLAWLQAHGTVVDERAVEFAARAGSLEAVRYLREEVRGIRPLSSGDWQGAASSGSIPIAACLHQAGCPMSHLAYVSAASCGSLDMVRWLLQVAHCPLTTEPRFLDFLVEKWGVPMGGTPVAKYRGKGWGVGEDSGLLEAVRLLMDAGCRVDEAVLKTAAKRGDLALVRLLHERGDLHVGDAVKAAATGGSPAVLRYIEASSDEWEDGLSSRVYRAAAQQGDVATLEALERMGCSCGSQRDAVAEGVTLCVQERMAGQGVRAGAREAQGVFGRET